MTKYGTAAEVSSAVFSEPPSSVIPLRPGSDQVAPARAARSRAKRIMDVSVAVTLLLLLLPSLVLIALAIRLTSRGPVIFRQSRTGLNSQVFAICKFRTMHVLEDGEGILHATRNDARVTHVGMFLRKTSLDELPQLWNVLTGHMSLVGPRPHAVAHDRRYGVLVSDYSRRFAVKPGITGLAQVRGLRGEVHDLSCMAERVLADCEYIERWSLRGDVAILLQTVPRIFGDRNAY